MTTDTSHPLLLDVDTPVGMPSLLAGDFAGAEPRTDAIPVADEQRPRAAPLARRHQVLLRLADVLALSLSACVGAVSLQLADPLRAGDIAVRQIVVTALAMGLAFHLHSLYRRPASRLRPSGWWRPSVIARCMPTAALGALGIEALLFAGDRMTLTAAVAMTLPAVVLVPFGRRAVIKAFGPPTVTRILVVGTGQVADRLVARLSRCPDTVVVGSVDNAAPSNQILGRLSDLPRLCREHAVDRIIVAFTLSPDSDVLERLRRLGGQVPNSVIPRLFE